MALLPAEELAFSTLHAKKFDFKQMALPEIRQHLVTFLEENPVKHADGQIFILGSFVFEHATQTQENITPRSLEKSWELIFGGALQRQPIFPEKYNLNNPQTAQKALQAAGRYFIHFKASLRRKTNPATILSVNRFIQFVAKNLPKLPEPPQKPK